MNGLWKRIRYDKAENDGASQAWSSTGSSQPPDSAGIPPNSTPKNIGIVSATAMGISLMIGSGIFSTPASVLRLVGTPAMALILWGLGAVISYGGATAFIELGLMYRRNGGTMRFLAHAYPKPKLLLAYLFSWVMVVCIRPGAIAANGPVIGKYWLYAAGIEGGSGWQARGIGFGCITLVTAINIISAKWSLRLINLLTAIKIVVILIIVITGIVAAAGGIHVDSNDNWSRGFRGTSNDARAYASALTKVFWAYDGFTNLVYSLGELRRPDRNLPWSIGGSVVIVGFLYIMANAAFFIVVPIDVAIGSEEILAAEFTYRVFGQTVGKVVLPVFIGLSVLGAICAQTYGVSRLLDSANEVGFVPHGHKICGNHKRLGTPVNSLAIVYVLTLVYLLAPPPGKVFDLLVDFVQWSTWLFYGLAAAGAIVLRFKKPHHQLRTFRSFHPLNALFIVFCIYITIFPFVPPKGGDGDAPYPFYLSPLLGLLTTLAGVVPWYFRMVRWPRKTGVDLTAWINDEEAEDTRDVDNGGGPGAENDDAGSHVPAKVSAATWVRVHALFRELLAVAVGCADASNTDDADVACAEALTDLCVFVRNAAAMGHENQDGAGDAGVVDDAAATVLLMSRRATARAGAVRDSAARATAAAGQALSNAVTQNQRRQQALLDSELGRGAAEETAYWWLLGAHSDDARTAGLVLLLSSVRGNRALCGALCAADAGLAVARRVGAMFGESADDEAEEKTLLYAVLSELIAHGQLGALLTSDPPLDAFGLLDALAVHCREHAEPEAHARLVGADLLQALVGVLAKARTLLAHAWEGTDVVDMGNVAAVQRSIQSTLAALVLITADMESVLAARVVESGMVHEAVALLGLLSRYLPRVEKIGGGGNDSRNDTVAHMFMFKRELVQIIGHVAHRCPAVQDLVRELDGLALVLDHARIDENHPFIREYAVVALRSLLDGNAVSQAYVEDMEAVGVMQDPQLASVGLHTRLGANGRPVVERRQAD
ncbi:methionine permease [Coemansia biformis]|uniref:Methionine permease n=1 Tax=Coemansia biformis TaxID=1286918 RepID=A0A9W7YI15_9FUNG|nr:methionine permease [Coemansia biformis]